jgi:hypothetical protein
MREVKFRNKQALKNTRFETKEEKNAIMYPARTEWRTAMAPRPPIIGKGENKGVPGSKQSACDVVCLWFFRGAVTDG